MERGFTNREGGLGKPYSFTLVAPKLDGEYGKGLKNSLERGSKKVCSAMIVTVSFDRLSSLDLLIQEKMGSKKRCR